MSGEKIEALRKHLPGVAVGAAAAGALSYLGSPDLPGWAVDMLKQWGPAGIFILGFAWYVPRSSIKDFIRSQEDQAVALNSLAESVKHLPQRDDMKFESILIGQSMLERGIEKLDRRLDNIEGKINGANS